MKAYLIFFLAGCAFAQVPVLGQTTLITTAAAGQVEPKGGTWKTWVLANGSQFRLPAPPDASGTQAELIWLKQLQAGLTDTDKAQVAYWDAGSASYRWVQWLQQRIVSAAVGTTTGTRQLALLNVAMYDALVSSWDSKYAYNRALPAQVDPSFQPLVAAPDTPSYPNEFAVAAGAAAAVLGYLYPSDASALHDLAAEAARSRLFAGVAFPSDYFAGLQLGDEVGQLVVQRGKSDGSDAVWTGTVPTGPGLWVGTNPSCPLCGTWKTWVLSSGSEFRPGPPIPYNSPAKQAELADLHAQPRPFADQAKAFFWQTPQGLMTSWYDSAHTAIFEDHGTGNSLRAARAYALMAVAHYDSMVGCWDGKFTYWAIRPNQLDPTLTTLFATPTHPSYPAAHACVSNGIADVMAYLWPVRAGLFQGQAAEAGWSRMVAGIHFQSDIDAGATLGHNVANAVINWAKNDGSGY